MKKITTGRASHYTIVSNTSMLAGMANLGDRTRFILFVEADDNA